MTKKENKIFLNKYILQSQVLKKLIICFITGFTSGLPLSFIVSLLPIWFVQDGIDIKKIGIFTLLQLPYSLKFLWAPFVDNYWISSLGRRRTWMLFSQILLLLFILSYSFFSDSNVNLKMVATLTFLVVLCSATYDIVIDAYRRDILSDHELGLGNSIFTNAYKLSSLIPGSVSLILTNYISWKGIFIINGLSIIPGILLTLKIYDPMINNLKQVNFVATIVDPFKEFFIRKGLKSGVLVLLFILLYKLGDSMALSLISAFYLQIGFSPTDIGIIAKNIGLWSSIIFGILGGIIILKIGINKALFWFGLVQIVTILGFAWIASFGFFEVITIKEKLMLALVVALEYLGSGLGTSAYVAFINRETNPLYSATQLALLVSLSLVPRTIISSCSGYLIDFFGYYKFFWLCFVLAIPGMVLLLKVLSLNEKNSF